MNFSVCWSISLFISSLSLLVTGWGSFDIYNRQPNKLVDGIILSSLCISTSCLWSGFSVSSINCYILRPLFLTNFDFFQSLSSFDYFQPLQFDQRVDKFWCTNLFQHANKFRLSKHLFANLQAFFTNYFPHSGVRLGSFLRCVIFVNCIFTDVGMQNN